MRIPCRMQKINADMIVIGAGTLVMIYTDGYMLIGGAIIAAPLAIMAYSVALQSVLSARKHMEKRENHAAK